MCGIILCMKKRTIILIAIAVIVIIAGAIWQNRGAGAPAPQPFTIDMAEGEQVASWDFNGAYTGKAELMAKADAEIVRLTGLLGSGQYPDYTLCVSIANQYGLKGDGKNELAYLEKALAIDSIATGLAWHNAGQLFRRLGADKTARFALGRAAAVQPITQYQQAFVDFLESRFPEDTVAIREGKQALKDVMGEVSQ